MKKAVINLLLVLCFMSLVKAEEEVGTRASLIVGAVGSLIALKVGVKLRNVKRKWGSLTVGVPAEAFNVPYTKENKKLLKAAKNKNKAFIKEKLRALNKAAFGTVDSNKIVNISHEIHALHAQAMEVQFKSDPNPRKEEVKAAVRAFAEKYPRGIIEKWLELRSLYAALNAIYNRRSQYSRLFDWHPLPEAEFLAIKEKFDKQLGILDQ